MKTVARAGDIRIPYVVEGDGRGPHLLFAHGLMGTGAIQRAQLPPLVDAGWTIVTLDQRGHAGASPVLDAAGYNPEDMGEDLWAVADVAGVERCWIGGGSMGAATSFRAARARPERVQGLIQVVPTIRDEPHAMTFAFDALADRLRDSGLDGFISTLRQLAESVGRGPGDELFYDQLRTHDPASLEVALRSVSRWIFDDVPSAFAGLPFPVIVFGWENDPIHPIQTARDVAAAAGVEMVELDQSAALSDPTTLGRTLADLLSTVRT